MSLWSKFSLRYDNHRYVLRTCSVNNPKSAGFRRIYIVIVDMYIAIVTHVIALLIINKLQKFLGGGGGGGDSIRRTCMTSRIDSGLPWQ